MTNYEGLDEMDKGRFVILLFKASKDDLDWMIDNIAEEQRNRIFLKARKDLVTGD